MYNISMTASLILIGGFPGVGKTTVAIELAKEFHSCVVLDPDAIRLEILVKDPVNDRLCDEDITQESTDATIAEMKAQAVAALQEGQTVIIASAFILASMRDEYEGMAQEQGVECRTVWLDADVEIRKQRAQERLSDDTNPSAVSAERVTEAEIDGEIHWPVVDASRGREVVFQDVKRLLSL